MAFDASVLCRVCYDPHTPCDFTCQAAGCDAGYHHQCLQSNSSWYTPLHRRKLQVHKNSHFANTFVCPHCVFQTVMGLPVDPSNEVHVQCLQAEHARQVFVSNSRAKSTTETSSTPPAASTLSATCSPSTPLTKYALLPTLHTPTLTPSRQRGTCAFVFAPLPPPKAPRSRLSRVQIAARSPPVSRSLACLARGTNRRTPPGQANSLTCSGACHTC